MKQKDLEIFLSINVNDFLTPKLIYEQYITPSGLASHLVHRAMQLGDISNKNIVDLCAGTGMLGISAIQLDGKVDFYEIDPDAVKILNTNLEKMKLEAKVTTMDIFELQGVEYDTALINPPFGINQKIKDMKFIEVAGKVAKVVYAIHDGSKKNEDSLPGLYNRLGLKITEMYYHEFLLKNSYKWHRSKNKRIKVLVVRAERN